MTSNLHIREIRWIERDICEAVFAVSGRERMLVSRVKLQRGMHVIAVGYEEEVTAIYQGDAAGLQSITHAIRTFCLVAQGEFAG